MAGSRTVAIHQPNYLPWSGYFHKIARCDVFVYLDAVQYPRGQSFGARNRIKTPNGAAFLTIPVSVPKQHDGKAPYTEVGFADDRWKEKHLKTVTGSYRRAPHYDEVYALYERELQPDRPFVELTIGLIEAFCGYLGIETKRVRLSDTVETAHQKTDLIVDICQALGADAYLSGTGGGRDYNDEELLGTHGIELRYDTFEPPVYPQLWGDFEPGLSVLDLLFNCGPGGRELVT